MGKIIMNGNAYGSVGSDVEANPQGTATDTLNTIGIDNVIYEIQGGGGGSSSGVYVEDNLYDATSGSFGDIVLDKSLLDYDIVVVYPDWDYTMNYDHINSGFILTKDELIKRAGTTNKIILIIDSSHIARYYLSVDGKTLTADANDGATNIRHIVGIKTSGDYYSPVIYSTEEREVGVWTDGKPLYQKTFDKMDVVLSDNSWTNNILGTTGIAIKQYEGYFSLDGYPNLFSYDYYRGSGEYFTSYTNLDTSDINVRPNMNAGADVLAGIITIWYTKDSDVPGSGQYNTLGVPTVHYSTDEQVIGTDYDGKPIYQKTYTNLGTINSSTNIDLQLSNISWITVDPANSSLSSGIPFPYLHPNANNIIGYFMDMNGGSPIINCRAGNDASSSFTLDKLTVRYKKTTD